MPKIDLDRIPARTGSAYPPPHDAAMQGRSVQRLGAAAGLGQFGANRVELAPGAMSALRHWHEQQDEFLVVLSGALVLIDDDGETPLAPGDCCAFPAGDGNAHHVVNRSDAPGVFVVVGTHTDTETGWYPDHDMKVEVAGGEMRFAHADGTPLAPANAGGAPDFSALDSRLTEALISGDLSLYRSVFHVPHDVHPRNGTAYSIDTEAGLREDFDLYHAAIRAQDVTDMQREVLRTTHHDPETCVVEARVTLLSGTETVVAPYNTTFRLERRQGRWGIGRVISSLGHIRWTRGEAGIAENRRFELD
jgi:uncharacterized cupin superfamily protein